MKTMQLTGAATNDSHMVIHNAINNTDIIIARVFQKHLLNKARAHGFIDHGKDWKQASNRK